MCILELGVSLHDEFRKISNLASLNDHCKQYVLNYLGDAAATKSSTSYLLHFNKNLMDVFSDRKSINDELREG